MGKKNEEILGHTVGMSKTNFSKQLRFWVRFTLVAGVVAVGLYFVINPATPKLYKLFVAVGLLGLLLYFFLGGGGGKGGELRGTAPPTSWQ